MPKATAKKKPTVKNSQAETKKTPTLKLSQTKAPKKRPKKMPKKMTEATRTPSRPTPQGKGAIWKLLDEKKRREAEHLASLHGVTQLRNFTPATKHVKFSRYNIPRRRAS